MKEKQIHTSGNMGLRIVHTDINSFDLDPETNKRVLFGYWIRLRKKPNMHCFFLLRWNKPTHIYTILLNNSRNNFVSNKKHRSTKISIKFKKKQTGFLKISQIYQVQWPILKGSDCFGLLDIVSNVHWANLATVCVFVPLIFFSTCLSV